MAAAHTAFLLHHLWHHHGAYHSNIALAPNEMRVILKLPHLVHPIDDLLFLEFNSVRLLVVKRLLLFVDDLDRGYICAITLIILELHIVVQQEVHKARLLICR